MFWNLEREQIEALLRDYAGSLTGAVWNLHDHNDHSPAECRGCKLSLSIGQSLLAILDGDDAQLESELQRVAE